MDSSSECNEEWAPGFGVEKCYKLIHIWKALLLAIVLRMGYCGQGESKQTVTRQIQ